MNLSRRTAAVLSAAGMAFAARTPECDAGTALDVKAAGLKTFYVDDRAGSNQIWFVSESKLEDFIGACNRVAGDWKVDPRNLETFAGQFWIRVEDIDTGIDLRNTHLTGPDWLDAAQHPKITIDVSKVENVQRSDGNEATMDLVGTCTLRGQTNPVKIPCTLTYLDESPETQRRVGGDLIRLRASFELLLSDYGVTGPPGSDTIGLKVADRLPIKITVFGSTQRPPPPLEADEPGATTRPSSPSKAPPKRTAPTRPAPKRPDVE